MPTVVHDWLVIQWWSVCVKEDSLRDILTQDLWTLRGFLDHFATRNSFYFCQDVEGIWLAGWTDRFMEQASFSLWIRQDKRHTKDAWNATLMIFEKMYQRHDVLIVSTGQEKKKQLFEHVGFTYAATLPFMMNHLPAHFLYMTADTFRNKHCDEKRELVYG